jgi:hypothetical protein
MTPKPVTTTPDPAVAWAEKLWTRLETNLLDTQNTLIAIIDAHAWEPLGYESFSKAWVDRIMSRITLAAELRPHVVYQMFSEGLTAEQVAGAVKGVTPESAQRFKEQQDNGVPPEQATTVRRHQRRLPGPWKFVHLKVDPSTLADWRRIAQTRGRSVTAMALEFVTAGFDKLR